MPSCNKFDKYLLLSSMYWSWGAKLNLWLINCCKMSTKCTQFWTPSLQCCILYWLWHELWWVGRIVVDKEDKFYCHRPHDICCPIERYKSPLLHTRANTLVFTPYLIVNISNCCKVRLTKIHCKKFEHVGAHVVCLVLD